MRKPAKMVLFLLLLLPFKTAAQYGDPAFADYLVRLGSYRDVLLLYDLREPGMEKPALDSFHFYKAWSHFHLQELPQAINAFSLIHSESAFYERSKVFSSWCRLYSGNAVEAKNDLLHETGNGLYTQNEAFLFQNTAIHLYNKDFSEAAIQLEQLRNEATRYPESTEKLIALLQTGQTYKPRSKGLAATLSAVVPGAGKVYAGETGAGISSFLIVAGLGTVAAENIIKSGLTSWNSLLFTGIFSVFYIGNIYGSMISIQTYRSRFNEHYEKSILATVILPLRDYYR